MPTFTPGERGEAVVDTVKATSAWGFAGMTASDIAALLAAFYTLLLIGEWFWKKLFRRYAMRLGWIKPQRSSDADRDPGDEA